MSMGWLCINVARQLYSLLRFIDLIESLVLFCIVYLEMDFEEVALKIFKLVTDIQQKSGTLLEGSLFN